MTFSRHGNRKTLRTGKKEGWRRGSTWSYETDADEGGTDPGCERGSTSSTEGAAVLHDDT